MKIYFINFIPFPPTLDLESTLGLSAMQFDDADCSVEICVDTLDPVGVLWVRSCSLVLGASNIFPSKLFQMTVNSVSQSNFIFHYIFTWLLPQGVSVIWLFEIRKESSTESICLYLLTSGPVPGRCEHGFCFHKCESASLCSMCSFEGQMQH